MAKSGMSWEGLQNTWTRLEPLVDRRRHYDKCPTMNSISDSLLRSGIQGFCRTETKRVTSRRRLRHTVNTVEVRGLRTCITVDLLGFELEVKDGTDDTQQGRQEDPPEPLV